MKLEINLDEEQVNRIKKYVEEERFKDIDDFFGKAVKLMMYAEDKKEEFGLILPKKTDSKEED
jgi:Arc/MetJ-type ribon-helix-helix transcriptional regulator